MIQMPDTGHRFTLENKAEGVKCTRCNISVLTWVMPTERIMMKSCQRIQHKHDVSI